MSQLSDVKVDFSADDWEREILADAKLIPAELEASLDWTNSLDFAAPGDASTSVCSDYSTPYDAPAPVPYDAPTPASSNYDFSQAGFGGVNEGALTSVYSTPYSTPSEHPATPEYGTPDALGPSDYGFDHAPNIFTSGPSTSGVSDYTFSPSPSIYPGTPGPSTPDPYPASRNHLFTPIHTVLLPRPRPLRSQTNTSHLEPLYPILGPVTRRRSLSTSAADLHTTASGPAQPTNPTFIRLQAPRSQSVKPSSKRRAAKHARSTSRTSNTSSSSSQSQGHLRLHSDITSVPFFVGGMVPTRLGDPLESEDEGTGVQSWTQQWQDEYMGVGVGAPADAGVEFRRMMEPKEMERSQRVIEIGAMSVTNGNGKGKGIGRKEEEESVKEKFEVVKEFLMEEGGYWEDREVVRAYNKIGRALGGEGQGKGKMK